MSESPVTSETLTPTWWRLGPGLWLAATLALLTVYLFVNLPGGWFGGGAPQHFPGAAMAIATGVGQADGGKLVLTGTDARNAIILTLATPRIPTRNYGMIEIDLDGVPDDADVTLFWRNDLAPNKMYTRSLAVAGGRTQDTMVAGDSNWLGRVQMVGLIVRGALAQPLVINGVTLKSASAASVLAERWRDWLEQETWSGVSLFRIVGGRAGMDLPLPLLAGAAGLLAGGGYLALRRWRRWAYSALTIAAILMAGWLLLDARWQWNLVLDAIASWREFAGKDLSAKRLAGADAEFERTAAEVRPLLAPGARLFVFAQDPVVAGRLAYLLLPAKVYYDSTQLSLPPPASFKSGDLILIYRKAGVQYSPERGEFRWNDRFNLPAVLLYGSRGAILGRVP